VAAWTTGAAPTPAEAEQVTRAELELGPASPLVAALSGRRPLVVDDFGTDARFGGWSGPWAKVLRGLGCRSLALVPLRLGHEVIGVLAAAHSRPGAISVDDLAFLDAFADRAAPIAVRARAYDQERESAEKLARLDRQKGEFLALVSHELRTPLTAVKGFVDTVLEHWQTLPDHRRRELLDRASSNADELNRLVGQLLDFARLDAASVRMTRQRIELREEVAHVLENLAAALAEHPVETDIPAGVAVLADPNAFADVLTNLLTNAAKFSSAGGRSGCAPKPTATSSSCRSSTTAAAFRSTSRTGLRPLLPVAVELADTARHRHRTHYREAVHRDAGRADQPRERARVGLDVLRVVAGGDAERGPRRTRSVAT
jgi:signal transduction histidine kinase